ncbi:MULTISPECIES: YitT family protein [Paenibacillus]|nr:MULTISPECIES: YitT family protein [Paenibacillus]MDR9855807.1 YitT family protein [Paenibacillus sp. VCA1]
MTMLSGPHKALFYRKLLKKWFLITAGSIVQGFAMAVFLFPHDIPSGGGSGIAVLLNYAFGMPMSLGFWFANFIFLICTAPYLGNTSTVGTIYVITVTSVAVNFFEVYVKQPYPNVWIDLLIGSVFLGTGVATLMKQRVSNGGIGFAALAIYKYKKIKPGTSLFWMNGFIFGLTALIIDWKIIILAIACQMVSTRIINWMLRSSRPRIRPRYGFAWRSGKK